MTTSEPNGHITDAPSDNTTLTAVLDELERAGYTASFGARDGAALFCSNCRTERPAADYHVDATRRMEGASDPDAEVFVVAATCPNCDVRGTAALGYGPEASDLDANVAAALDISTEH